MLDVEDWLNQLGLGQYRDLFAEHAIDGDVLVELTDEHLKELGLPLGHRVKLARAIRKLDGGSAGAAPSPAASSRREAERRHLTVMFCDLVGSTSLSGRLDPEDMRDVLTGYQNTCAGVVTRFGGHVAKYMGDGVLAYFGYPRAHEDDVERAARAGLELVGAIGQLRAPDGTSLAARVGIATGFVVVGDLIGEGAAQEEAVVGETPNLAARLQQLASPGGVVVGSTTRRLIGTTLELRELGASDLKGFPEPVTAWQVVGSGRAETRFEAASGDRLSPFIGREQEIELLVGRWRQAQHGEGQVALLEGEAGVGKSRVLEALRGAVGTQPHTRLRFQCSSFRANSPLYPIVAHLLRAAAIRSDDPPEEMLPKLDAVLARTHLDRARTLALIASLLSIPGADEAPIAEMGAQERRHATAEALIAQLLALARCEPLLILFEDVHWIDPTTEGLLHALIERSRDARILILITFRPEYEPPWRGHNHVTSVVLNRLDPAQSAALARAVAGARELPTETLDHIVAKTDGVPLFVEELTKAVLESELLVERDGRLGVDGPLAIPATLQDSLMARLDRLAPVKELAHIGACIGRQFSRRLLQAVSGVGGDELDRALDRLVESGLVFRRGDGVETVYLFKHALVQDVAYGSLLRSRRQQIHHRIAQAILQLFPERAESEPERLAQHFAAAGEIDRAIGFWERAGARAVARCANAEAVAHFNAALNALPSLPPGRERDGRELKLQVELSVPLIAQKGFGSAVVEACARRARTLSDALGVRERRFAVLRVVWNSSLMRRPHRPTYALAGELMAFAERNGDDARLAVAHRAKGYSALFLGRYTEAEATLRRGIEIADGDIPIERYAVYGEHPAVVCRMYRGWALAPLGRAREAVAMADEAVAMARRMRHPHTVAWALCCASLVHVFLRDAGNARALTDESLELATTHQLPQWRAWSLFFAGWARTRDGPAAGGLEMMEEGADAWRATGAALSTTLLRGLLAEAYADHGRPEAARAHLDAAFAHHAEFHEAYVLAELHRVQASVSQLERRPPDVVRAALVAADEAARAQGVLGFAARAACARAAFEREQGDLRAARAILEGVVHGSATIDFPDVDLARTLLASMG